MTAQATHTFRIFYCYTHEDDALREQLAKHLSPLRRLRYITAWYDRDIRAGTDWERESEERLDTADIILLLISADFLASDYHYTVEMQRALEKHRAGTAHVIPILLRPVEWEKTPIGELAALPASKKPITQWEDKDAAWLNVVQGINQVITKLLQQRQHSLEEANIPYPEQGPLSGQMAGNKYLLGELIGEGGFSQVYKAQHLQLQRQQAIKVLLERHFRKREFRDRFLREAQMVASLDHPHIIHLDDFWVEKAQAYLVMPFISEGTLQDVLGKRQGLLEQQQVVFYLEQICSALEYAHEKGIVHLDLKPQNLLVRKDNQLLLSDFGLAHLMKEGAIEGGSSLRVGTPHYMAPEHIRGTPERRSDLFSLGVILYQMLLGRLPFEGMSHETIILKNIMESPPAVRVLRPELSQSVQDVLEKALEKQPELRYQTANELFIAFQEAITRPTQVQLPTQKLASSVLVEEASQEAERVVHPSLSSQELEVPEWLKEAVLKEKETLGKSLSSPQRLKRPEWLEEALLKEEEKPGKIQPLPFMQKELSSVATLYVKKGKEPGRIYEIRKEVVSIGRSDTNDIILEDFLVGLKNSSILSLGNGSYVLKDELSAGSKVNGQFINLFQAYPLQEGDHIQLGQTVLVFRSGKKEGTVESNVSASLPETMSQPSDLLAQPKAIMQEDKEPAQLQFHELPTWLVSSTLEELARSRSSESVADIGASQELLSSMKGSQQDEKSTQSQHIYSTQKELPHTASLYIEEGKEPGRVYEIRKASLRIGRSRDSDIFLDDLKVNRLHASIVNMGDSNYWLLERGSVNGSKVNGQPVNRYRAYLLQEGDRIQLGQHVLVFRKGIN